MPTRGEEDWVDCVDGEACGGNGECLSSGVDGEGNCIFFPCADACECPAPPATGDAVVPRGDVAGPAGPDGMPDCYLSCQAGQTCPDGQICVAGLFWRLQQRQPRPGGACDPPNIQCGDGQLCVVAELDQTTCNHTRLRESG